MTNETVKIGLALPRYLRRALESKNEKTLTKAVRRAMNAGWTKEQLETQYIVNLLRSKENGI